MDINIDELTEAELVDLNHRIVERLRFFQQARAHSSMLRFRIGQQVAFDDQTGRAIMGVVAKYNKKSVSVVTTDGYRWTVSPQLLRAVGEEESHSGPHPRYNHPHRGEIVEQRQIPMP